MVNTQRKTPKWGLSNLTDEEFLQMPDLDYSKDNSMLRKRSLTVSASATWTYRKRPKCSPIVATKRFPFFGLPRELRDEVYHYALTRTSIFYEIYLPATGATKKRIDGYRSRCSIVAIYDEQIIFPNIAELPMWFRYNKQLRMEGLQQFYHRAKFIMYSVTASVKVGIHDFSCTHHGNNAAPDVPAVEHAQDLVLHPLGKILPYSPREGTIPACSCWLGSRIIIGSPVLAFLQNRTKCLRDLKHLRIYVTANFDTGYHLQMAGILIKKGHVPPCYWCGLLKILPRDLRTVHNEIVVSPKKDVHEDIWKAFRDEIIKTMKSFLGKSHGCNNTGIKTTLLETVDRHWYTQAPFRTWICKATSVRDR